MKKIFFLLLLSPFMLLSQQKIQGIVLDENSNEPLPYASIKTDTNFGDLTNFEGKFTIETKLPFSNITISYVGYKTVTVAINPEDRFIKIKLKPSVESLSEVVITAKENPAIKIIKNTIENKGKNNIEKALNSFKYNAYNKVLVTANPDSIDARIDSIFKIKDGVKSFVKLDSSNYKFKKEVEEHHLYISEKISEYKFEKGKKRKEVVLATRMAGFKQPIYELFAITFQDFSFYKELYTIAGTKYTNPIADNALKTYYYKILDTVTTEHGESYQIYFKPKEKKEFAGLEGLLYIDTKSYALTKVIAELKGILNIKAEQYYTYNNEHAIWFPSTMNVILKKGDSNIPVNLFGGMVQTTTNSNDSINKGNDPSDVTYFISKSTNTSIEINVPIEVKKSASTIEFSDDAYKKSEQYWNTYRTDSLTERGKVAYKKIDSIVESENVEKKIDLARNLIKGYFPTKYINLNLGKIINLNNYEGLRVGFGGETNQNFSSKLKLDGYVAYGTKDEDFKYSFGVSTRVNKELNTWIGVQYTNDIQEAASLNFITKNTSFSLFNPRNLNISKFYNYKTTAIYLLHDIQPNLEAKLQLSNGSYTTLFNYNYNLNGELFNTFDLSMATLAFQYNPRNEYMNSPVGKIRTKEGYPQINFQVAKSFDNILNGDFNFTQFNLKVLYNIERLRKATTSILAEGGLVIGDAPLTHLFNSTPNYTYKNPWIKRVTFAGKNSFETMSFNEFISNKYVALHVKHKFKPFKITSKFNPQLTLVSRGTVGAIENSENHLDIDFKSLDKGYYESGFELNSLYKGLGLSTFYRYGPYTLSHWHNNLAIKLTFKLSLGF